MKFFSDILQKINRQVASYTCDGEQRLATASSKQQAASSKQQAASSKQQIISGHTSSAFSFHLPPSLTLVLTGTVLKNAVWFLIQHERKTREGGVGRKL